jgi:phosphomannomutase
VAVPDPAAPGGWRALHGDEVGWLLAEHVLAHTAGADRVVACSLVSSTLLGRIAAAHGVHHVVTPTGFKWIARAAERVPGGRFAFGYEEALGYAVHDLVRDKDGISALVAVAEVAALARAAGTTVVGRLAELERRYGVARTAQLSARFDGPGGRAARAAVLAAARRPPPSLGGAAVARVEDLAAAEAPVDVVVVHLGDARVLVRPSGTEPKVKIYLEVVDRDDRRRAEARLAHLRADVAAWLGV